MKKIALLLFTLLYLVTSTGVAMNIHLCKGRVVSVKFFDFKAKKCPCGKKKSVPCCDNIQHLLKIKDDHKISSNANFSVPFSMIAVAFQSAQIQHLFPVQRLFSATVTSVSPPASKPIFIRNHSLLI